MTFNRRNYLFSKRSTIHLLMVARWPLGGIRTYMKYVCKHMPAHYKVTILVCSNHEDEALRNDACSVGAHLVVLPQITGLLGMVPEIRKALSEERYDVVLSQGFISGFNVFVANLSYKVPHVLTIHGILEDKYLSGKFGYCKRSLLSWVVSKVDILYAVSNDILHHLEEQLPSLRTARCRKVVIPNGIEIEKYPAGCNPDFSFRRSLGISEEIFLFGFLGRFMQQKGFNYLIDAVELMESQPQGVSDYLVLAVGSGDFLEHYQADIQKRNLGHRFRFVPFMYDVSKVYSELDVVVMPSLWEACPLQPMEALCSGTPVIASNCIGLRETVRGTPALVFQSTKSNELTETMYRIMKEPCKKKFEDYAPTARERFDVRHTTNQLVELIEGLTVRL